MEKSPIVDERTRLILCAIVHEYIRDGDPVGSRTLSKISGTNLSPATVRNVMSDLEQMGFIKSLHASSGRVPSAKGFRFFVDNLLTVHSPDKEFIKKIRGDMGGETINDVLTAAANTVSQLTRFACFVATPQRASKIVQLRFVKLSTSRVLVIAIAADGEVINRVFESRHPPSERELSAAARFFNTRLHNLTFDEACRRLRTELKTLHGEISVLLTDMIQTIDDEIPVDTLQIAGEFNLLDQNELTADVRRLRKLYDLFNQKKEFLDIIGRSGRGKKVCVFIGNECGHDALNNCSLVLSPFASDNAPLGYLGVIGPKRMPYQHVIPTVEFAAQTVAHALRQIRGETNDRLGE